jgi:GAF domain-containing protein
MRAPNTPNQGISSDIAEFEFDRWRVRFMSVVLWLFCGFGLILFGSIFFTAEPAELVFFGMTYIALLVVTVAPLQYRIKVGVLLASGELIGLYGLVRFGPWSDSVIFFLAATIFASLLFKKRIDLWIFVINTTFLLGMAYLDQSKIYPLLSKNLPPTVSTDWITYILDYFVIGIVLTWALHLLKTEFRSVAEQFGSTLHLLTRDRAELEQRVEERTLGLTKKTDQLRAASYIARQTAEAQDLASLLDIVVNLITDQFGYNHAGIFLLNETGDEAILQAASSEGGKRMLARGHSLTVGSQGIVGYVAQQKKPRIALDVGTDAVFFNNPDLPMTRSEVALPLLIRNRVLGVLDIQSDQPQAFHIEDVDVLQTLADQVSVAIDNARLLGETQTALQQLETVTGYRTREAWAQKLEEQNRSFTYTPLGMHAEKVSSISEESALKTPILLRGQKIGTIAVEKKDQSEWSNLDQAMIDEVAYQVGLAVDNLRLLEDAQQRAKREQTIGELATRFSQALDIDSLLQTAAREMGQLPDVAEVSVYIGQMPEQAAQKRRAKRITG